MLTIGLASLLSFFLGLDAGGARQVPQAVGTLCHFTHELQKNGGGKKWQGCLLFISKHAYHCMPATLVPVQQLTLSERESEDD
jgi:hypothetical protein